MAGQICSSLRPFANDPLGRTCSVSGRCCLWRLLATGRARVVICGVLEVLPVRIHRPKISTRIIQSDAFPWHRNDGATVASSSA
jgi:hypothetical protein